ncbi:hypothetical protein GA0115245_138548 [Streptomyces sp. di188]|nr:hypothetical protein GA0115238_142732 [Streptomyces sp. di50b]SCE45200.1 hypothetical protein GA0115245_138548 [Streptomyces sp. di188]
MGLGTVGGRFRITGVVGRGMDALFFHLYGINRDDTSYILDTFNVTRDNDIKAHGEYRTKNLILAEYDRMAAAGLTLENPLIEGESGSYRSTLTPPPVRALATTDLPLGCPAWWPPQGLPHRSTKEQRTWYA